MWGFILVLSNTALGVLPLPYSIDPPEDSEAEVATVEPGLIPGYAEILLHSKQRAMELPAFGEQSGALNYEPGQTFAVPDALRHRVDFWKKIYTVYTSSQAIVHDSENLDLQYGVFDISAITENKTLSPREKRRRLNRYLRSVRKEFVKRLKDLHKLQHSPQNIALSSIRLYRTIASQPDADRFLRAAKNLRIQVGQRDKIVQGFMFGGRYWPRMMEIFEEQNIPKELTRLPLVESAFDLTARSKVGASGVWQFMRSTGKRFLRIDRGIDERNDPLIATWAAAGLLKQNLEALGEWPLAITAYNHGREGMARAVRKLETTDLATIIQKYNGASFGFASSNFFSEFLAILEVEREYRKHFGAITVDSPIEFEQVAFQNALDFSEVARRCQLTPDELASLNPAFTNLTLEGKLPVPAAYPVKIPPSARAACMGNKSERT